jgi:predicted glycosyltransferase
MRVWVDLANSPQVMFFRPILSCLQARGHDIVLTLRDFAQTREIADDAGLSYTALGRHGGRRLSGTVTATLGRASELVSWARRRQPQLAVSSNVYSHALACRRLRLPLVNLYDYDPNPANHLAFRLARRVIVPEAFPDPALRRFGSAGKTWKYPGVKEEVYLSDFVPQADFLERSGLPTDRVLVVLRPPSDWSPYHRKPNPLFDGLVRHVAEAKDTFTVFLPRIPEQARRVESLGYPNVQVARRAYDGANLVHHADLVISAGGTMNREAAVLGTPVYTVYGGELGATDRYLVERGRLRHVGSRPDVEDIALVKKPGNSRLPPRTDLVEMIAERIVG